MQCWYPSRFSFHCGLSWVEQQRKLMIIFIPWHLSSHSEKYIFSQWMCHTQTDYQKSSTNTLAPAVSLKMVCTQKKKRKFCHFESFEREQQSRQRQTLNLERIVTIFGDNLSNIRHVGPHRGMSMKNWNFNENSTFFNCWATKITYKCWFFKTWTENVLF
jgi:hypothetical protein